MICETVKCADGVENAFVLRLYECEGVPERVTLTLPHGKSAALVNFLEEEQCGLTLENQQVKLALRPFEICTVLVRR